MRDLAPLFVTGALEDAAADAVRDHLRDCDDPHLELLELGAAATALLETVEPAEPPVALKGRLMAAAEADLREGRHASTAASADASSTRPAPDTAPAPGPAPGPAPTAAPVVISAPGRALPSSAPARVVALDRARAARRPSVAWLAVAAAVIIAIALGGWNVALRGQLADAEAYRTGVDAALALASQPGSVAAVLVNQDGGSAGLGVVGADGTVRLALRGLVPTSGTQVYTAWGIAGDAAPVPLGDIRVGAGGTAAATGSSPMAQPGMVLALTLEPVGGAQSPTLPIVASGVAVAPAG